MSALLAVLLAATPGPTTPGAEALRSCFGPPLGFEARSDRFHPSTVQMLPSVIEHMNNRIWRRGWFVLHSTVRDLNDRAQLNLVRRRQATALREFTRRGIARARIRFAPPDVDANTEYDDLMIIESVVPERVWVQVIPANVVC